MKIHTPDSRATLQGPATWFTGTVLLDELITNAAPSHLKVFRVAFAPGARTAWHTHPLGQTLHVLTGVGLVQLAGQPIQTIRSGDTVSILPDELHWHGATPTQTMTHLAIQESDMAGTDVVWLQQVTEAEYTASDEHG